VEAPMHPEYPSGHAILAGAVGAILKADIGATATPTLTTSSPTAKGASRQWTSVDAFVREVCDSRIYAGIHFRTAVDVGAAMGQRIGELATTRLRLGQ
jgi:membrane-associated phospholipid phosphatase